MTRTCLSNFVKINKASKSVIKPEDERHSESKLDGVLPNPADVEENSTAKEPIERFFRLQQKDGDGEDFNQTDKSWIYEMVS